ncbi:hypothetical protein CW755_11485 [Geobacillus thermodenitrificans]|nr:hypothetical protein [Geobacillus thermodenitrificans]OQP11671.1 hypothetical protein B1691_00470 [Geobacillus sp. 47C-IIb]PJW22231.1 hypothetical protein CV632_02600 [Geobacillus thermodenitrificans]PTR46932.1 hypothetical protein CW755_11485 [Geobacillus thermodenitrificans]
MKDASRETLRPLLMEYCPMLGKWHLFTVLLGLRKKVVPRKQLLSSFLDERGFFACLSDG